MFQNNFIDSLQRKGKVGPSDQLGHVFLLLLLYFAHFFSLLAFSSVSVYSHSYCFYAQVFGRTLVHKFHIFYIPYTEWNLLTSLSWDSLLLLLFFLVAVQRPSRRLHRRGLFFLPTYRCRAWVPTIPDHS